MEMQMQQKPSIAMKIISYFICAMTGLVSGGLAYLYIPDFLQISNAADFIKKGFEILWTTSMAALGTLAGLLVKYWWDQRGKRIVHRWFNKKKKR